MFNNGWIHTRALSRLKADLSLTWRKSAVWTTKSKQSAIQLSVAKFKGTKSAMSRKKKATYSWLRSVTRNWHGRFQMKSPGYSACLFAKVKRRQTLPEEEVFFSLVAYSRDFKVVKWLSSVFHNLNPSASEHSLQSGRNHYNNYLNFHVQNFEELHVNSVV